ncbi:MAG: hypothetical protein KF781_06675 [Chitinophagaceae bacterium]|nr:hypothetical protein [Chitinophagaceae bacterium]MCW5904095.1 hypothetical protein [Chitinophagaceae bacterium]
MFTKTDIEKFFIAEKQISLLFIIISIAAIVVAAMCWFVWSTQFCKGVALSLFVMAIVQLSISVDIYLNSNKNRINVVYAFDMNPNELKLKELPRIEKQAKKIVALTFVSTALLVIGAALFFYSLNKTDKQFLAGIGAAMIVFSIIVLSIHFFSQKRVSTYKQQLREFVKR